MPTATPEAPTARPPCRTVGCNRSTSWPKDPETRVAYCRQCTDKHLSAALGRPARSHL